jgi:molecular chaperone DnaK (HSP70)
MDSVDEYFNNVNKCDQTVQINNIVLGIDLGTTNSCIGIWRNNNLEIIPDEYGNRTVPSVVAFTNKNIYVGLDAKKQMKLNPESTFYDAKRLIGRRFDDETIKYDQEFLTYKIGQNQHQMAVLECNLSQRKKYYTPEEISSMILIKLKHMAENYLKQPITDVVITVPAYFNDSQREATRTSAEIAGLNCLRIINEPTSAALAYGLNKKSLQGEYNVLVYDLGGGTLDVSILNISDGVFEVIASTGNTHLGGEDFDHRLMKYCINSFRKKYKCGDIFSSLSLQKLKISCENGKKLLSTTHTVSIVVPNFHENNDLMIQISRQQYEKICGDLFLMCLKPLEDALKSAKMEKQDIDEIILVGGGTRMVKIKDNIVRFFNGLQPNDNVNPDEVVAAGGAIQGYMMSGNDPFSEKVVLLDIIPLSLGVETIGGVMNTLIPRNSVIPITRKKKYTTDTDYETSVLIKIFEGERKLTKNNFKVGEFELMGLESAPRGYAQLEVKFMIDINGIISVKASDLRNPNNENQININSNKGRLTQEEISQLIEEAKDYATKDKIDQEKKQLFYEIEDLCSNIKLNLLNGDCKLKSEDKQKMEAELSQIYEWLKNKSNSINFQETTDKELKKLINKIKSKYGTLILKINLDESVVKEANNQLNAGTTVFGNEEDEDTIFQNPNDECEDENNDKNEIRNLKSTLIELCYSVLGVVQSESLNIKTEQIQEIKEYIDDILLWTHVKEKITKMEYENKIKELNDVCNELVSKNAELFTRDPKDELEQTCIVLLSCIKSNHFSIEEEIIKDITRLANETLDWIIENSDNSIEQDVYLEKIKLINSKCDELYGGGMTMIDNDEVIINNHEETYEGTLISEIKYKSSILSQLDQEMKQEKELTFEKQDDDTAGATSLEDLKKMAQIMKQQKKI